MWCPENVPGTRLPRPWSEVAGYDELMANWQRLDHDVLDETEDWAVTRSSISLFLKTLPHMTARS